MLFEYIVHKLSGLSTEKLEAVIFDSPQIRQPTFQMTHISNDPHFKQRMNEIESCAWISFVLVVKKCLGNKKGRQLQTLSAGYDI